MNGIPRRDFMKAAGWGMAVLTAGTFARTAKAPPSERVRHAIIGLGSRGRPLAKLFDTFEECELVAICDLDPQQRKKTLAQLPEPGRVAELDDFRKILDDPEIDSVTVATPDHWHTSIALAALLAGKHVYVEKPCSHNVREGVLLMDAAQRLGKCVQHGTQSRSGQGIRDAIQFLRDGKLGKVRMAKAINQQLRKPIGRAPESDPPPGVNYDLWLGPAPLHRFTRNRWHYQWHWFWYYGTGDIGNDGIHQIDVARWGLGMDWPKAVSASGGQLVYDDDHETPDTQIVTFEYDDCYLLYEMRLWTDYRLDGHDNGNVFYGDNGFLEIGTNGCEVTLNGQPKQHIGGGQDQAAHVRNFLDCVKADNPAALNAPIADGAVSAGLSHLGNIATRVGRRLHFEAAKVECTGDSEATALLAREYRSGYELPKVV